MAALLANGKLKFDDVASYIEKAINEVIDIKNVRTLRRIRNEENN